MRVLIFIVLALLGMPASAQTLILVSIDGFRWDYLDKYPTPNLNAIAAAGVRATRMTPVYPSKTFPAHLSLSTGLPPSEHGIVDNHFCDRQRGQCYHMGDGKDDASWLSGVPLWNLVELHGHTSATYFWPESDARVGGLTPTFYFPYAKAAPYPERVIQVLDWLELPKATRPRLITLYFSKVDTMGHGYGPDSPQVAEAIAEVDALIGNLWSAVKYAMDDINLMVVSDHGMAELHGSDVIDTDELPQREHIDAMNGTSRVTYWRKQPGADVEGLRADLAEAAEGQYTVLTADTLVARGHAPGPRTPDIVIEATPPAYFRKGGADPSQIGGAHGYPDSVDAMGALFVAAGPALREGLVIEQIHQLDVYPVAAKILGVEPVTALPSDGGALNAALR